jgi:hypothetical protein
MEIETLNNKTSNLRSNGFINSSLFPYDLPRLVNKMKDTPGWKNGELAATILLKSPGKKIVLTVLHDDTEVKSFQSGDSVTFQIIKGKIEFHTHKETVILNNDQFLTLHDKIKFSLTSLEESVFLLTFFTAQ